LAENPGESVGEPVGLRAKGNGSAAQLRALVMGSKEFGFSNHERSTLMKQIKCEKLLLQMRAVVPWQPIVELIEIPEPIATLRRETSFRIHRN
jgi:hypothetical protein